VPLRYVVGDVLQLPREERDGSYWAVLMEMGVLHYFLDLKPLMGLVAELLAPGGGWQGLAGALSGRTAGGVLGFGPRAQ
jgi:hypothetical protein